MNDKPKILVGLILFLILAAFPIWYTLGAGGDTAPPDLEPPDRSLPVFANEDDYHCVEDGQWMNAHHMNVLDQWRDRVVRKGERYYKSVGWGTQYEMSLTKTCMGCHTNRETFCSRCHEYANVQAFQPMQVFGSAQQSKGRIRCWNCHIDQEGD